MSVKHDTGKTPGRNIGAILLCLCVGSLCCPVPAAAQAADSSSSPTNRVALGDCVRRALSQSPLLKAADQDRIVAREIVGEARASYYPTLGVRSGVSRWQGRAFLPSGLSAPNLSSTVGPTDDWSAGGFARYLLYDSGVRRATFKAARIMEATASEDIETARLNLVFDVHQAFCQLAVALDMRIVAGNGLANAESHLVAARKRWAAGDTMEADVLRAQVEVDNARAELIRSESLISTAQGNLNATMGLSAEIPIEIDVGAATESYSGDTNIGNLMEQAIRARPEIKAAQSAIAAARQRVRAAQGAFGPKALAEGSYGRRDDSSALEDEEWFAGITVELIAFEGFSKRHNLAQNHAGVAKAEAVLESVTLNIRREVWAAAARLREAAEMIQAATTQFRDAEESLRLMSARYNAGAVTVTDLLDAQTALAVAEARKVQARWNCRLAQSALLRATGSLTGEE